jgi:hypothetical protein
VLHSPGLFIVRAIFTQPSLSRWCFYHYRQHGQHRTDLQCPNRLVTLGQSSYSSAPDERHMCFTRQVSLSSERSSPSPACVCISDGTLVSRWCFYHYRQHGQHRTDLQCPNRLVTLGQSSYRTSDTCASLARSLYRPSDLHPAQLVSVSPTVPRVSRWCFYHYRQHGQHRTDLQCPNWLVTLGQSSYISIN